MSSDYLTNDSDVSTQTFLKNLQEKVETLTEKLIELKKSGNTEHEETADSADLVQWKLQVAQTQMQSYELQAALSSISRRLEMLERQPTADATKSSPPSSQFQALAKAAITGAEVHGLSGQPVPASPGWPLEEYFETADSESGAAFRDLPARALLVELCRRLAQPNSSSSPTPPAQARQQIRPIGREGGAKAPVGRKSSKIGTVPFTPLMAEGEDECIESGALGSDTDSSDVMDNNDVVASWKQEIGDSKDEGLSDPSSGDLFKKLLDDAAVTAENAEKFTGQPSYVPTPTGSPALCVAADVKSVKDLGGGGYMDNDDNSSSGWSGAGSRSREELYSSRSPATEYHSLQEENDFDQQYTLNDEDNLEFRSDLAGIGSSEGRKDSFGFLDLGTLGWPGTDNAMERAGAGSGDVSPCPLQSPSSQQQAGVSETESDSERAAEGVAALVLGAEDEKEKYEYDSDGNCVGQAETVPPIEEIISDWGESADVMPDRHPNTGVPDEAQLEMIERELGRSYRQSLQDHLDTYGGNET